MAKKLKPGDRLTADHLNEMSRQGERGRAHGIGHTNLPNGTVVRPTDTGIQHKWIIIREVGGPDVLFVGVEQALRHPDYYNIGNPLAYGQWIGISESGVPLPGDYIETMECWPHRRGKHYQEYKWDGVTRLLETQILLAHFVDGIWHPHPDPPFVARRRPSTGVQTPCTPQGF